MRLTIWKLAVPIGAVLAVGCVEKVVPSPGPVLGADEAGITPDDDPGLDAGLGGGLDADIDPGAGQDGDGGNTPEGDGGAANGGDGGEGNVVGQLSCETYCAEIMRVCTDGSGQYESMQQCLNMCEDTPLGADEDTSGDTIGCRLYHTRLAEMTGDRDRHCRHAGPTGGSVCGQRCEVLCDRALKLCTEDRGYVQSDVYRDEEQCLTICSPDEDGNGGYAVDTENELAVLGDTVNCRLYHLRNAYENLDPENGSPITHCDHVREFSTTCRDEDE